MRQERAAPYFVVRKSHLRLLAGPVVWSLHFLAVYILTAVVAAQVFSKSPDAARLQLIGTTLIAAFALAALLLHSLLTLRAALRKKPISEATEQYQPKAVDDREREVALSWVVIDAVSFLALLMVSAPIAVLPI